jgi:TfoX/Sxy family transcriptional regulator of competence genes
VSYDEQLAERIRKARSGRRGITEKKMFGGLSFLLRGNMCCGIAKGELMVRVGPDAYPKALARKHARPMDFTGKPLTGYVYVAPRGVRSQRELRGWVEQGLAFARSLPPR